AGRPRARDGARCVYIGYPWSLTECRQIPALFPPVHPGAASPLTTPRRGCGKGNRIAPGGQIARTFVASRDAFRGGVAGVVLAGRHGTARQLPAPILAIVPGRGSQTGDPMTALLNPCDRPWSRESNGRPSMAALLKRNVPAGPGRSFRIDLPTLGTAGRQIDDACCCSAYFLVVLLVLLVLTAFTTLAAAGFLAAAFFAAGFLATFFAVVFFAAAGFLATFFAAGLRAVFFAAAFLTAGFLAAVFLAAFLAAGFFAADFLAVAMVRLSSSSVGSGCPVKAWRNASTSKSLLVA